MTFLNPERDPLGAGYHIIQSKIALGSGGLWGKGFLKGTQSQLSFLPEKQTDFVFTMLAEEAGLVGALGLLVLFLVLIVYGFAFALRAAVSSAASWRWGSRSPSRSTSSSTSPWSPA